MKNKQIFTFLITGTIIFVDGCKFSEKDGLDFTFIWRRDEHETSPRGTSMIVDDGWFSPNYHTCAQTAKTITNYHNEFEQAQNEW